MFFFVFFFYFSVAAQNLPSDCSSACLGRVHSDAGHAVSNLSNTVVVWQWKAGTPLSSTSGSTAPITTARFNPYVTHSGT